MLAHLLPTPPERTEAPPRNASSAEAGRTCEGARFAELLRGQRPAAGPSAAAAPASAAPAESTKASDDPAEGVAEQRPVPGKARLPSGARPELAGAHPLREADGVPAQADAQPSPAGPGAPADPAQASEPTDRAQEDARAPAAEPAAAAFAASAPAAAAGTTAVQGESARIADDAPRLPASRARRDAAAGVAGDAAGAPVSSAAPTEPAGDAAAAGSTTAPLVAAAAGVDSTRNAPPARDPAALLAPAAAPESARAPAPAAPSSIALPTPLAAPNFGEALATQVSIYARDGLQQAELRLNPPEMGPIGVQIEVTGTEARIHFHAAQAATREVIERALPELAGALRSEGLTLAGGGVFDRPADARDGGFAAGREGTRPQREPGDTPAQERAPRAARVPQGRLDVFA